MNHNRLAFLGVFIILALFLTNCPGGGGGGKKAQYDADVTQDMRLSFSEAETAYRQKKYSKALELYKTYIENYEYNALTDESYYKTAKIHFLKKDFPKAINFFEKIIQKSPDEKYRAKAGHYAGYAAFLKDDFQTSYRLLKAVKPQSLPIKLRLQYHSLSIFMAQKANDYKDFEVYSTLRLYDAYESSAAHLRNFRGLLIVGYKKAISMINMWVMTPSEISELPDWLEKYPTGPAREMVDLKIAKTYFTHKPKSKETKDALLLFLKNYPRSESVADIQMMLDKLGLDAGEFSERQFKIGVITPSGEGEDYGKALFQGVKCAAGFEGMCGKNSGIELFQEESGWDASSLKTAFENLIKKDVSAIIALVPGQLTFDAADLANRNQIPVLLVTQQSGTMTRGDSVFQMGLLPEKQIEDLVSAAFQKGYRKFGIFFPDVLYGEVMTQLFENEVKKQGGKVMIKVSYNKKSSDSYAQVRKLKKYISLKGNSAMDVGFDALFIPDSFLQINSIVESMKYHKLTSFPLLGTNTWNDDDLTNDVGEFFPGSFFVDLYSGSDSSRIVQSFRSQFSQSFGDNPSVLEALGYDSLMIIRHAVNLGGVKGIQETLNGTFGFRGVTGVRGFEKGRAPVVQTTLIRVRRSYGVE